MFDRYTVDKLGKQLPPMYECLEAKPVPHPFVESTLQSMSRRGLIEQLLLEGNDKLAKRALPDGVELDKIAQEFDASSFILKPSNWAKQRVSLQIEETELGLQMLGNEFLAESTDLTELIFQSLHTEGVAGNV